MADRISSVPLRLYRNLDHRPYGERDLAACRNQETAPGTGTPSSDTNQWSSAVELKTDQRATLSQEHSCLHSSNCSLFRRRLTKYWSPTQALSTAIIVTLNAIIYSPNRHCVSIDIQTRNYLSQCNVRLKHECNPKQFCLKGMVSVTGCVRKKTMCQHRNQQVRVFHTWTSDDPHLATLNRKAEGRDGHQPVFTVKSDPSTRPFSLRSVSLDKSNYSLFRGSDNYDKCFIIDKAYRNRRQFRKKQLPTVYSSTAAIVFLVEPYF